MLDRLTEGRTSPCYIVKGVGCMKMADEFWLNEVNQAVRDGKVVHFDNNYSRVVQAEEN